MSESSNDYYNLNGASRLAAELSDAMADATRAVDESADRIQGCANFRRSTRNFRFSAEQTPSEDQMSADETSALQALTVSSFASWEQFAQNACAAILADMVCVVDADGLVVAAHGEASQSEGERVGARLLIALDQAREIDPHEGKSATFRMSDHWLTTIRSFEHAPPMTVIIKTETPLGPAQLEAFSTALSRFRHD